MLDSLARHLAPAFHPVLHLVNRGLTHEQLVTLASIVETRSIALTPAHLSKMPRHRRFPCEAAIPLLLAELLPADVSKVLFLDPDILVLEDLGLLWQTPLDGHVLAAVTDQAIPTCGSPRGVKNTQSLGIPRDAPYFNAGVMLIDLDHWRETNVTGRALEYLRAWDGRTDFYHQEALNSAVWNEWLPLGARWNIIASLTGRPYGPAVESPGIVHFSGYFKPWKLRISGPYAAEYDKLLAVHMDGRRVSLSATLLSMYDNHVRDYAYPVELALWKKRLI